MAREPSDISDHIVLQRASVGRHCHSSSGLPTPSFTGPIPPYASDVLVGLSHSEACFQPTDAVVTELVGPVGGQALREEEVRRQVHEAKIPRHHTDDLVRNEIDDHSTAENLPVASESSLPVPVAEDRRSSAGR